MFFFFKQKTAYELRISDWSSDVCSSDLDDGRLESIARVATAEHRESGWLLRGVKRTYFENNSVTQTEVMEEHWTSQLDAAALAASASNLWRPRYMSARDLRSGINYRTRNGRDASEFEEHSWGRCFSPLTVLSQCLGVGITAGGGRG